MDAAPATRVHVGEAGANAQHFAKLPEKAWMLSRNIRRLQQSSQESGCADVR